MTALEKLQAAQQNRDDLHTRIATADAEVGKLTAEIAAADPDSSGIAKLATARVAAQARSESYASRLPAADAAVAVAGQEHAAEFLRAAEGKVAALGVRAGELTAAVNAKLRATLESLRVEFDAMEALKLETAVACRTLGELRGQPDSGALPAFAAARLPWDHAERRATLHSLAAFTERT